MALFVKDTCEGSGFIISIFTVQFDVTETKGTFCSKVFLSFSFYFASNSMVHDIDTATLNIIASFGQ